MGKQADYFIVAAAVVLLLAAPAFAQERVQGKDEIYLQPSREYIVSSPLCQVAREHASEIDTKTGMTGVVHRGKLDPATQESDLTGLMTVSEDVVLAGISTRYSASISPSGESAIQSFQVKILHTWKGDLKVGQTIIFSVPSAQLLCAKDELISQGPVFANWTGDENFGPGGYPLGPFVLFLRHAQGTERGVTPDLRLAGGDGTQGLFYVDFFVSPKVTIPGETIPHEWPSWYFDSSVIAKLDKKLDVNGWSRLSMAERFNLVRPCNGVLDGSIEKCASYLTTGKDWILVQHQGDPLFMKHEGMETKKFFGEMDSAAQSLGLTTLLLPKSNSVGNFAH